MNNIIRRNNIIHIIINTGVGFQLHSLGIQENTALQSPSSSSIIIRATGRRELSRGKCKDDDNARDEEDGHHPPPMAPMEICC